MAQPSAAGLTIKVWFSRSLASGGLAQPFRLRNVGCPILFRVLCGKGGLRNSQPETPTDNFISYSAGW